MYYLYNAYLSTTAISDTSELVAGGFNIMTTSHIALFTCI